MYCLLTFILLREVSDNLLQASHDTSSRQRPFTSVSDARSNASKSSASRYTHSIFQPTSARSNSTMADDEQRDDIDEFNELMSKINQSEQDLELASVTSGLASHRVNGADATSGAVGKSSSSSDTAAIGGGGKLSPRVAALDQVMNTINGRPRNASYGENDLNMTSDEAVTGKATKLNGIANNMTPQARVSTVKNPLENSVQNIRHKAPVNQVNSRSRNVNSNVIGATGFSRQSSRTSNPDTALDRQRISLNAAKHREMSAIKIQRFFRRHRMRKKSGEAALKRMLEAKRQERESHSVLDPMTSEVNKDADRKKIREEKARQARLQAIQVCDALLHVYHLCVQIV